MDYFVGVDPGGSGGLACIDAAGKPHMLNEMPDTLKEIWDWFLCLPLPSKKCVCAVIEQVGGYIPFKEREDKAHGGQPGSHMFKFGQSYGALEMALLAIGFEEGVDYRKVIPRIWQKELGIEPRRKKQGETRPQFKSRLARVAKEMFPKYKVIGRTADALLIAEYCRRTAT